MNMRALLVFLCLSFSGQIAFGLSVVVTNFAGPETVPIVDASGSLPAIGSGVVAVGMFPDEVDFSDASAVKEAFIQFGLSFTLGFNGFSGVYQGLVNGATVEGDAFWGRAIYTVIGNGTSVALSNQLLVYKHQVKFVEAAPGAVIEARLTNDPDALVFGGSGNFTSNVGPVPGRPALNMIKTGEDDLPEPQHISISGEIRLGSQDGAGLAGVSVSLSAALRVPRIAISSEDGSYLFNSLPAEGEYTITPTLSEFDFEPESRTILVGDEDVSLESFVGIPKPKNRIYGEVRQSDQPLEDVAVILRGPMDFERTARTDENGQYEFNNLVLNETYLVAPSTDLYVFSPIDHTFTFIEETRLPTFSIVPQGQLKWSFTDPNDNEHLYPNIAIGPDGKIYVPSVGGLLAISSDGEELWRSQEVQGQAGPAVGHDGTIYVTEFTELVALNPDGSIKWRVEIPNSESEFNDIESSPAIASDGTIYVASPDDELFAITPDGDVRWRYSIGGSWMAPVIGPDGTIYIAGGSGPERELFAISPTGTERWTFQDEKLSGLDNSPAIGPEGELYAGFGEEMYILNPDGTVRLRVLYPGGFGGDDESTPTIGPDGNVYVGLFGRVFSIKPEGEIQWTFNVKEYVDGSVAVGDDGTIYLGYDRLYALNPDRTVQWYYPVCKDAVEHLASSCADDSSPAIGADGAVYIWAHNTLYAFESSSTGAADSSWPMFRHDAARTGRSGESPSDPSSKFHLTGQVQNGQRLPLADVAIQLHGPLGTVESTTSDADGQFGFSHLLAGNYTVIPSKDGVQFEPPEQLVNIGSDATLSPFVERRESSPPSIEVGFDQSLFRLAITGDPGSIIQIQRSDDLLNWEDWQSITLGDQPAKIEDSEMTTRLAGFYRVKE